MTDFATMALWIVTAATIVGILARPWHLPEWIWAVAGAGVLVALGAIAVPIAAAGIVRGADVYAFLFGIMCLAEMARQERIFDVLAVYALRAAGSSQGRLFLLIYAVGILVTALLSNDTTIVVLTPAVLAVLARTKLDPLPYLFACAFVANAASFVLPMSNPANLVIYDHFLPPPAAWLAIFGLAAAGSVVVTFVALRLLVRRSLSGPLAPMSAPEPTLDHRLRRAFGVVSGAVLALIGTTTIGLDLGYSAALIALLALVALGVVNRTRPLYIIKHISWQIIPLVGGLFVIVAGLEASGALGYLHALAAWAQDAMAPMGSLGLAGLLALACGLFNNLPVALAAGYAVAGSAMTPHTGHIATVAIDLGSNLSVTGSLATLLWLLILRRASINVSAWQFFRYGILIVLPSLVAATLFVR